MAENGSGNNRIVELDILRGLAIAAVVGTHVTTRVLQAYTEQQHIINFGTQLSYFFNQFFRFSVPMFLFLSGVTLTISQQRRPLTLINFYKKRFIKILVPYVLWTIFLTYYLSTSQSSITFGLIYHNLLTGDADYHLYFMVVILQCYLAFPLLYSLLERCRATVGQIVIVLLIVLQGLLYFFFEFYKVRGYTIDEYHAFRFAGFWAIYFIIGIACGLWYRNIAQFAKKLWLPVIVGLFILSLGIVYWEANDYFRISHYAILNYFRPTVLVYSLVGFLVFYRLAAKIVQLSKLHWFVQSTVALGSYSFGIYFVHTIILRKESMMAGVLQLPSLVAFFVLFIGTLVGSFGIVLIYHIALRPLRYLPLKK